jgi:hypothetical protein
MNNIEDKPDCIDSLKFGFFHTGTWRGKKAILHPSDPRNARAAQLLAKLAGEADQLSDKDFFRLQPYYGFTSERWREAISATARLVGFKYKIKDLPTFVDSLLETISAQNAVAA